jgi:hypothetical protein
MPLKRRERLLIDMVKVFQVSSTPLNNARGGESLGV